MKHLTDGDWAQNDAGCGCDAQPRFRTFNPALHGRRFDPREARSRFLAVARAHLRRR